MNREQTALLLRLAAEFDHRNVVESDVHAWYYAIGELDFDDCAAAVRAFYRDAEDGRRVTFGQVRAGVKAIREGRLSRAPMPVPDADPDDPAAYQAALLRQVELLAEGRALEGPSASSAPPPPEITSRHGRRAETVAALKIQCPWCHVGPNRRCGFRSVGDRWVELHAQVHPSRIDAVVERSAS